MFTEIIFKVPRIFIEHEKSLPAVKHCINIIKKTLKIHVKFGFC